MSEALTVVRPDAQGEPDDIVIDCDRIHLERMDQHYWWLGVYRGDKRICFHLAAAGNIARVAIVEDELGAVDDTQKARGG
jgi:hypothetical protein